MEVENSNNNTVLCTVMQSGCTCVQTCYIYVHFYNPFSFIYMCTKVLHVCTCILSSLYMQSPLLSSHLYLKVAFSCPVKIVSYEFNLFLEVTCLIRPKRWHLNTGLTVYLHACVQNVNVHYTYVQSWYIYVCVHRFVTCMKNS